MGENVTVGLRLGYVIQGGGPRQSGALAPDFLPFHGEARAGYTIGVEPFREAGLRGTLFLHGGIAQVDTEYKVPIREDTSTLPPVSQIDNPTAQTLSAYRKTGTAFAGFGAAITYAVLPSLGFSSSVKIMQMFPSSGTIVAFELACVAGF